MVLRTPEHTIFTVTISEAPEDINIREMAKLARYCKIPGRLLKSLLTHKTIYILGISELTLSVQETSLPVHCKQCGPISEGS